MSEIYKEIKETHGGSTFRLATKEEVEESEEAHQKGKCDGGFCTSVFYDVAGHPWDTRHCAICHKIIGLI